MLALFNGCSHTEGAQLTSTETWAHMVLKSISFKSTFYHIFSRHGRGGEGLFGHFNNIENIVDFSENNGISIARSGKGNDAICFETINYIEYLKQINQKPDYVFIQWSGPSRKLIQEQSSDSKFKTQFVNPHSAPQFNEKIILEPLASSITLTYVKILQDYLNFNKINYVFINYMGIYKTLNSFLFDSLDFSKIVQEDSTSAGCIVHIRQNNLTIDEHGHPNQKGYQYLTSKVCDILKTKPVSNKIFLSIVKGGCEPLIFNEDFLYRKITVDYDCI